MQHWELEAAGRAGRASTTRNSPLPCPCHMPSHSVQGEGFSSSWTAAEHHSQEPLNHHLSQGILLIWCLNSTLTLISVCKWCNEHLSFWCSNTLRIYLLCFSLYLAVIMWYVWIPVRLVLTTQTHSEVCFVACYIADLKMFQHTRQAVYLVLSTDTSLGESFTGWWWWWWWKPGALEEAERGCRMLWLYEEQRWHLSPVIQTFRTCLFFCWVFFFSTRL